MATYGKKGRRSRASFAVFQNRDENDVAFVRPRSTPPENASLQSSDSLDELAVQPDLFTLGTDLGGSQSTSMYAQKHGKLPLLPPFEFGRQNPPTNRPSGSARNDVTTQVDAMNINNQPSARAKSQVPSRRGEIQDLLPLHLPSFSKKSSAVFTSESVPAPSLNSDQKLLANKPTNKLLAQKETRKISKLEISNPIPFPGHEYHPARVWADDPSKNGWNVLPRSASATVFKNVTDRPAVLRSPTVPNLDYLPRTSIRSTEFVKGGPSKLVKQFTNNAVVRKVKEVLTEHTKKDMQSSIPPMRPKLRIRSRSFSELGLLAASCEAIEEDQTPETSPQKLRDDFTVTYSSPRKLAAANALNPSLKPNKQETPILASSPELQRALGLSPGGSSKSPASLNVVPDAVEKSPKLQKFFGTNEDEAPGRGHSRVVEGLAVSSGSPKSKRRSLYPIDGEDNMFGLSTTSFTPQNDTVKEEELFDEETLIGLGIKKPSISPLSGSSISAPTTVDRNASRETEISTSDFSGFDFFPDETDANALPLGPVLNVGFDPTISPLQRLPNVMAFTEAPAHIKLADNGQLTRKSSKREGVVLAKSPVKRSSAGQYVYKPERVRAFGESLSTIASSSEAQSTPRASTFFGDSIIPRINIKRASDASKQSSTEAEFVLNPLQNKRTSRYSTATMVTAMMDRGIADEIGANSAAHHGFDMLQPEVGSSLDTIADVGTPLLSKRRMLTLRETDGRNTGETSATSRVSVDTFDSLAAGMIDSPMPPYEEYVDYASDEDDELQAGHDMK